MKVLLSWMEEFVPGGFGDLADRPEELGDVLTSIGLVVESVERVGNEWAGIIVAEVLGLRPHPEADKIQLVDVDTGGAAAADGSSTPAGEALQICCGAFNMSVGDRVPLATLGTTMPGGLEIAQRKLRGELSNGMLCAAGELGLADDFGGNADGILLLDGDPALGTPLAEVFGRTTDVVFDIDVEGNRPDALSVMGVARDLAAKLGVPFEVPAPNLPTPTTPGVDARATVRIDDGDLCPRFGIRVLDDVAGGTSPGWMVQRLEAAGMRSISPIVDISNYVMLERGQPNHTYDLDTVAGATLGVRMARDGEQLVTLDDQTRDLTAADGLIVDGDDTPIGLAGVMGGAATEISDSTTAVLLEAAVWDRMTIAKTSRRLNLRSEASTRFERGADPMGIEAALDRFCELAAEICGATIADGTQIAVGSLPDAPEVRVRASKANLLLNADLALDDMAALLEPIGFTEVSRETGGSDPALVVRVPTWRPDSSIEEDVIEEIGRHRGYDLSGRRVPTPDQTGGLSDLQRSRRRIKAALVGAGCAEALPLPFLAPGDLSRAGLAEEAISLTNPLVAEESLLRTSLLPGLLKAIAYNQSHRATEIRLFEVGSVYLPADGELPDAVLPNEMEWLAAALVGHGAADAVRLLQRFAAELGLEAALRIQNGERAGLHPTRSAEVVFRGRTIGEVGEVSPDALEAYGIDGRVAWLQLAIAPLVPAMVSVTAAKPVSRYPSSDLDLAFLVPDDVAATDLIGSMRKAAGALLADVELFDVFRSESLEPGTRSLAYRLRLQADDHTLTDDEVAATRAAIVKAVAKRQKAVLRG